MTDNGQLKSLFTLCNEHAARFCLQNDLEKASELFDKAEVIMNKLTSEAAGRAETVIEGQGTLLMNLSVYYER